MTVIEKGKFASLAGLSLCLIIAYALLTDLPIAINFFCGGVIGFTTAQIALRKGWII